MGTVSYCVLGLPSSVTMGWHNGVWWPLYTPHWYAPKVSQYMFDPYSFTHVLHGVIFQRAFGCLFSSIQSGFLKCMCLELGWEIIENSPLVMRRFRENSGTSGQYKGDSVQNILGDLLSCAAGYALGTVFQQTGVWWASLVWVAVSEVGCTLYMRDSLALTIFALTVRSEALMSWQAEGLPQEKEVEPKED